MAFGGRSQLRMSEETFDFVCTTCAEDNKTLEAVKYCVECSRYCCQLCVDAHKLPALRSHNLLDVSQGKQVSGQPSSLPEFPTEICSKHKGKVMDMYCEGHNVVGCSTCFVKDHKLCQDSHIHSIPDMIDTIFKLSDCKLTQKLLKDLMVSMETVSKSKDTKLQTLNEAKKEALDQVTIFQKALVAIVRKAAESSRKQVEDVYKDLKNDILQDKHNAETISKEMQATDDKLNRSEGNRVQHFVCTKIAEEIIKEAKIEQKKQELKRDTDVPISFLPDNSLLDYINALQGIGQVEKQAKQKHDLYKLKRGRDISIKLPDDSNDCWSRGCCLIYGDQLLVTDYNNKKLKRIDIQKMSVVDYCTLGSTPIGVCCISKHEVAVACDQMIQFVSIQNKMSLTKQIETSHEGYDIAFNDGRLYVTDGSCSLYVYGMTGALLKTITRNTAGKMLFNYSHYVTFNESGNKIFVGGGTNGLVSFDGMGNYMATITDSELSYVNGVCIDGRGNMFVVGGYSDNVVQFTESGEKVGVVVKKGDGVQYPRSVCFHQGLNMMFVTMLASDVIKMYELE